MEHVLTSILFLDPKKNTSGKLLTCFCHLNNNNLMSAKVQCFFNTVHLANGFDHYYSSSDQTHWQDQVGVTM